MHNCPSCNRKFEKMEDFPLVKIISYEGRMSETDTFFFSSRGNLYVHPDSKLANRKAPIDIVEYFEKNPNATELIQNKEHTKYKWKKVKFGNENDYECYEGKDAKKILGSLNPYLTEYLQMLKGSVGKEVAPIDILPKQVARSNYEINLINDRDLCNGTRRNLLYITDPIQRIHIINPITIWAELAEIQYQGLLLKKKD